MRIRTLTPIVANNNGRAYLMIQLSAEDSLEAAGITGVPWRVTFDSFSCTVSAYGCSLNISVFDPLGGITYNSFEGNNIDPAEGWDPNPTTGTLPIADGYPPGTQMGITFNISPPNSGAVLEFDCLVEVFADGNWQRLDSLVSSPVVALGTDSTPPYSGDDLVASGEIELSNATPPVLCFWTDVVKVEQECDDTPPPTTEFHAYGNNNVTTVGIGNACLPTRGAGTQVIDGQTDDGGNALYNGVLYIEVDTSASNWTGVYGGFPENYEGSVIDCELRRVSSSGDILEAIPLDDITGVVWAPFGNGNMFNGFIGVVPSMPALTEGSLWQFAGTVNMTDTTATGAPVSAPIVYEASQGVAEVRCIDFPGSQDPFPFPFLSLGYNGSVGFADSGGYGCDVVGDVDFTVDGVPYTQLNFENHCS